MKVLTGKFKKFTLFDLLLISLGLVVILFFGYLFFRKTTYLTVKVKVGESDILYQPWAAEYGSRTWFAQMFHEDMTEKDGLGMVKAQVLSVYSYDTAPSKKAVYLTLKLATVYNRASDQYTFKGNPLLVGSQIKLYLNKLLVNGLIVGIEGVKDPREKVNLTVETQVRQENPVFPETAGIPDYIASAIKAGDEVKDDQGNPILKIIDRRIENAKKTVVTSDGRVILQTDPLRKDLYLTLKINATKINDQYFIFDDVPILIGANIPLNFETISVQPEITKISQAE